MLARRGAEELLIDPGTFTYSADPAVRDQFRGTAFHNTVRIDQRDQAAPVGPFLWENKPEVERIAFSTSTEADYVEAACRYRGCMHLRRVLWLKPHLLVIFDDVSGPPGEHTLEQFWHPGVAAAAGAGGYRLGSEAWLWLCEPAGLIAGWRSEVFGHRDPATAVRVEHRGPLPWALAAVLQLAGPAIPPELAPRARAVRVGAIQIRFPPQGGWLLK